VTWLIRPWHDSFVRDMTHSSVTWLIRPWHDSFVRDMTHSSVTWLIRPSHDSFICDHDSFLCNSFICEHQTCHDSFVRDMTHLYVTWLIHIWRVSHIGNVTHVYTHQGANTPTRRMCKTLFYFTWRIHIWRDMTPWYVTWLIHTLNAYMTRLINTSHFPFICTPGRTVPQ